MNKGLLGTVLVVAVVGLVVGLFVKNTGQKKLNPWQLLPNTPDMVLETSNPANLYAKLKPDNDIWKSLLTTDVFSNIDEQISNLDSLLKSDQEYYSALFSNPLLIAFYGDSISAKVLFVSATGKTPNINSLSEFLSDKLGSPFNITPQKNEGYDVIRISNNKTSFHFALGFTGNMMIASSSESLLNKGIKVYLNHSSQHFTYNESFVKLKKTAGKKVNTHLYLNGGGTINLLKPFITQNVQHTLIKSGTLFRWAEADLFLKNSEFVLNGLSIGNTNVKEYQRFINQEPQNQNYINILPSNTTLFLFQGISDYSLWKPNIAHSNDVDINKLSDLIGPEIVLVSTARNQQEYERKSFVIVRFKDSDKAQDILNNSAKKHGKINIKSYGQYRINKLKSGDFCAKAFGESYGVVNSNYFSFIDDYVIFSNSVSELTEWLRHYETGKTLDLNSKFNKFEANLTENSNFTLFVGLRDFSKVIPRFVNKQTASEINKNLRTIKQFEGILLQMSSQQPFVYTGIYVKQGYHTGKPEVEEKDLSIWKVKLEDDITGKPYPVKDHTTGRFNIIVFDKSFNVYLIKYDGTVLWKKQLDGLPESDVFQVDYFKNRKIQYLFNTASKIYLIDKNGNFVKHYPIKITPSATNGLNVFDYNKKRDYRIVLAKSDKRIYNYNLKGKKVRGWKNPKMSNIVVKPIQRLVANKKDYLMVTDINNSVKILNRKGNERIKIKGKLKKAENSGFYVNRTNSKGVLITTNESGKLVYISSSGRLRFTDFGTFSPNHFFLYEDFDGNGSYDFIYVDGNKLTVFDRFKKILFSYKFNSDIHIKPTFFNLSKSKKVLGIVSDKEKTIYLFDKKGNPIISKGLLGEIPFTVTGLKNNREINLITGSGNTLFNYKIK